MQINPGASKLLFWPVSSYAHPSSSLIYVYINNIIRVLQHVYMLQDHLEWISWNYLACASHLSDHSVMQGIYVLPCVWKEGTLEGKIWCLVPNSSLQHCVTSIRIQRADLGLGLVCAGWTPIGSKILSIVLKDIFHCFFVWNWNLQVGTTTQIKAFIFFTWSRAQLRQSSKLRHLYSSGALTIFRDST